MRQSFTHPPRAGDETTALLQPCVPSRSYFTYSDLCHRALGSLQLISEEAPSELSGEGVKIYGYIYLPVHCFFDILSYLDRRSYAALDTTSKRMRTAILRCQSRDALSGMPMVRIDPTSLMNRLRGISTAVRENYGCTRFSPENADLERNSSDESDGEISIGFDHTASSLFPTLAAIPTACPFIVVATLACAVAIVSFSSVITVYVSVNHVLILSGGICLIIVLYMLVLWERLRTRNPFLVRV